MNIYQICQNNSDLLALLVLLIVFCVFVFIIIRNIRRFQRDIREWGQNIEYGVQRVSLDDDGELGESDDSSSTEVIKGKRKKKDTAPSVSGCLWQQFIIAFIGLVAALLSFLAVSNPLVSVTFESICNNIVNVDSTPIVELATPTLTIVSTDVPPTIQPTITFAPTFTLSPTPPSVSTSMFHPLTLTESLNVWTNYLGLSSGQVNLNDIPFNIGRELNTFGCRQEITATTVDTAANIDNPHAVYLLVNSGNGFMSSSGLNIGRIELIFDGGDTFTYDLSLGNNIRDWATSPTSTVVTNVTSPDTLEVWRGRAYDGREGRIDLLTIEIPLSFRSQTLNSIRVVDLSGGSLSTGNDPCIQVQAITVESRT